MDIRNINEQVPQVEETEARILQEMYVLGIEQFSGYKSIEKLPDYPLDINNPKSQVILKDFIGRVIEELTEGFESTDEVVSIYRNYGWNNDCLTQEEYTQVLNSLANANEEQADALGFFFTLLLYSNILPEDIYSWANKELTKGQKAVENLEDVMAFGIHMILEIDAISSIFKNFKLISETIEDKTSEYIKGFKEMSPNLHTDEKNILFQIVYVLNLARNTLKNRTWKQSPVITKELEFQDRLVEAFYYYMGFLSIMGFTPLGIYELYFKKERLNEWRITTDRKSVV